jgi:hypothetical protein
MFIYNLFLFLFFNQILLNIIYQLLILFYHYFFNILLVLANYMHNLVIFELYYFLY